MSLSHFQTTATPLELVCRLGLPQVQEGNLTFTKCPRCGDRVWILPHSFVCDNGNCQFKAGSALDFLRFSEGSYRKAGALLLDQLPERLASLGAQSREHVLDLLQGEAITRRALLDFFLRRRSANGQAANALAILAIGYLRREDVDIASCRSTIFIMQKEDIAELSRLCRNANVEVPPLNADTYYAIPYFLNHHTLASILFAKPGYTGVQWISCEPTRLAYSGLLDGEPHVTNPRLCTSYMHAGRAMSKGRLFNDTHSCYAVAIDAKAPMHALPFTKGTFLLRNSADESLGVVAELNAQMKGLQIDPTMLETGQPGIVVSWDEFAVTRAISTLSRDRQLNPENTRLISTLRLNKTQVRLVSDSLRTQHLFPLADSMAELVESGPIVKMDRVSIYATPYGYYASGRTAFNKTEITNFTIELKSNVVFPGSPDLFHEGFLHFNGNVYPTMFRDRDFDSHRTVEAAARLAEAQRPTLRSQISLLPSVPDRTNIKYVLSYLSSVSAHLPIKDGISHLGWNADRSRFFGRAWEATENGVTIHADRPTHPGYPYFEYFSQDIQDARSVDYAAVPSGLKQLIAQVLAIVARGYFRHAVGPIVVKNSPEARTILSEMFKATGQLKPIILSFNMRAVEDLESLYGFPGYAFGYTQGQISSSKLGLVMLGDSGMDFAGSIESERLTLARAVFRQLLTQVLPWFIRTKGASHRFASYVTYEGSLLREGASLIKQATGEDWLNLPEGNTILEAFLASIPSERTAQFISYDLALQKVFIQRQGLPKTDTTDLALELGTVSAGAVVTDTLVEMDALSGLSILESFYQKTPTMTVRTGGVDHVPECTSQKSTS